MLDWFMTIPGILIICGVILLVIAVVLFVLGSKKDKKAVVNTVSEVANDIASNEEVTPIAPVEAVDSMNVEVASNEVSAPEVESTPEPIVISEPEVSEVQDVNVNTEEPAMVYESTVEVEPVVNIPEMDVPQMVEEVTSEEPVSVETNVYGGESPVVNFETEVKPVSIYGGNDPLEATQSLPKMEEVHAPYGLEYPEVKVVEPVVEQPAYTPVEDTVSIMPEVTPVEEATPSIEVPAVEPVVSDVVENNTEVQESVVEEL